MCLIKSKTAIPILILVWFRLSATNPLNCGLRAKAVPTIRRSYLVILAAGHGRGAVQWRRQVERTQPRWQHPPPQEEEEKVLSSNRQQSATQSNSNRTTPGGASSGAHKWIGVCVGRPGTNGSVVWKRVRFSWARSLRMVTRVHAGFPLLQLFNIFGPLPVQSRMYIMKPEERYPFEFNWS